MMEGVAVLREVFRGGRRDRRRHRRAAGPQHHLGPAAGRPHQGHPPLNDLETIADWLALEDPEPGHVDVMLLFGGSLPDAWDAAAAAVQARRVGTLVLVGGVGHTTDVLRGCSRQNGRPRPT